MQEMNQGETYEEDVDTEEVTEEDYAEASEEEQLNRGVRSALGIDFKILVLIGAAAFIIVIVAIVIFTAGNKKDEDIILPDVVDNTSVIPDTATGVDVTQDIPTTPTPTPTQTDKVWDDALGMWVDAVPEPADVSDIGTEEIQKLRGLGYTGDEIDFAIQNGFDTQALIDAAQGLRDKEAEEALHRMSSSALEPEFKFILDATYMGQPGHDFVSYKNASIGSYEYDNVSITINADYEKCPVYGLQLQLKCKIADDQYVWYQIDPMRYAELPDSGNIVLRVDYVIYGDYFYVTDIVETNSTLNTIDASSPQNPLQHTQEIDGTQLPQETEAETEVEVNTEVQTDEISD